MMNNEISLPIIGLARTSFIDKFGIPRQSNLINSISYIEMRAPYDDLNGFLGLDQFSHIWLLWQFHDNKRKNNSKDYRALIRPPRLGGNEKIGVFASRSMYRPSAIGLSVVEFIDVKRVGQVTRVYIRGADLLDGTPIVDIKPYLQYADSFPDAISGYAQQQPKKYQIIWEIPAEDEKNKLLSTKQIESNTIDELQQLLALDPTPAYQQDNDKEYGLSYANINVKFKRAETIRIVAIEKI